MQSQNPQKQHLFFRFTLAAYTKLLGKRCHRASINATKLTQSKWVFKECETMFFTDSDNTTKKSQKHV